MITKCKIQYEKEDDNDTGRIVYIKNGQIIERNGYFIL